MFTLSFWPLHSAVGGKATGRVPTRILQGPKLTLWTSRRSPLDDWLPTWSGTALAMTHNLFKHKKKCAWLAEMVELETLDMGAGGGGLWCWAQVGHRHCFEKKERQPWPPLSTPPPPPWACLLFDLQSVPSLKPLLNACLRVWLWILSWPNLRTEAREWTHPWPNYFP